MERKTVEVIRYYACDGTEFNLLTKCIEYEQKLKRNLYCEIQDQQIEISRLKNKKNETRLRFLIHKCDAFEARHKIGFHENIAKYYEGKLDYQFVDSELQDAYREIHRLYDKAYEWFGTSVNKSRIAKKERRQKSLRWRQENTPDKWRTPNKIRVSKQTKKDNNG